MRLNMMRIRDNDNTLYFHRDGRFILYVLEIPTTEVSRTEDKKNPTRHLSNNKYLRH